ncbi:LysM peptidoglycan-binding domain-containing protein [Aliiroseovarius sp. F20344]|uniref:LysM peptidoglycan-binding domain-containing protein n=1 Tax=Aliiroseovarius sp. F20344 TaxID=2926414 RepID=UPI001FF630FD|nr:LysM peptidoglycan-binding domain-containing protein [Aliiroseovarius sp. F20344]MCK0143357.1 LysM peptidoglycan-binding domain-containing protein [Aliiroseovarius sp. F20344]
MAGSNGGASGAGKIWIGVGVALAIAAAAYGIFMRSAGDAPVAEVSEVETTLTESEPASTDIPEPEASAESAPEEVVQPETPATEAPRFDVVRVDPEGRTVVAGQAAPGVNLQLLLNGEPLDTVSTDASGNFVALLNIPVTEPGQLSLQEVDDAGQVSENQQASATVLIEPVAPTTDVATTEPAATDETASSETASSETASSETSDEVVAQTLPVEEATPAPRVLLADDQGITVLQDSAGELTVQNVVIDAISYDDAGEVALSGRATAGGNVRVYLDNEPIETTSIPDSGQWRLPLPDVASGVYTLRVDELAPDGTVTSRTETPFKREEPAQVAAASEADTPRERVEAITVQPGATLWAIARTHLGEGLLYVQVFDVNREKIKDPDLIYPGQVFAIPGEEQAN